MRVLSSNASKISVELISEEPGYLVIADVWYPGWQASVDGNPVPVMRANYLFKAVPVPNGEHEVTVVYQPRVLYLGAGLSGLAFFGLLILVVIWLGFLRQKSKD